LPKEADIKTKKSIKQEKRMKSKTADKRNKHQNQKYIKTEKKLNLKTLDRKKMITQKRFIKKGK
jgi:hypothetical protein